MRRLVPRAARRAAGAGSGSGAAHGNCQPTVLLAQQRRPPRLLASTAARAMASAASGSKGTAAEPQVRPPSEPLVQRVLKLFGYGDSLRRTKNSEALLQACIAQAGNTTFYRAGRVSDSFRSAHGLLVLHVWMLHKRLLMEGEAGKVLEEALFDRLWEETTARIRNLKARERALGERVPQGGAVVRLRGLRLVRRCLGPGGDGGGGCAGGRDGGGAVPACVGYVYLRDEQLTEPHVLVLAEYVIRELKSLQALPAAAVFESRFKWGALPAWTASKGGSRQRLPRYVTSQGRELTEAEALAGTDLEKQQQQQQQEEEEEVGEAAAAEEEDGRGEWRTAFSEQGRVYWWNVRTRESTWEKPY